jgi:hypothetical protein
MLPTVCTVRLRGKPWFIAFAAAAVLVPHDQSVLVWKEMRIVECGWRRFFS